MKLIELIDESLSSIGIFSVSPRVSTEQVEAAHQKYCEYYNKHSQTSDQDPIDFEAWCKIYKPEICLLRIFTEHAKVSENLI